MNYSISEILDEAKLKRKGHLKSINLATLAYTGVILLLSLPSFIIKQMNVSESSIVLVSIFFDSFLNPLIGLPILMGVFCMGLARARDQSNSVKSIFGHFNKKWKLFGYTLLYWVTFLLVLIVTGFLSYLAAENEALPLVFVLVTLVCLLFIYLNVQLLFTGMLIVDKGLGVFAAIKHSMGTVRRTHAFWLILKGYFIFLLWSFLALFTLGVAYFWIIPRFIIAYGIVYRELFDMESPPTDSLDSLKNSPLAKYA
jgi:membrane-anchored glycerophosphoryl diester phosphodiesterase (GDPDase)